MLRFWDTALELFTENPFARMTSLGSGGYLKTMRCGDAVRWKWLEGEDLEEGERLSDTHGRSRWTAGSFRTSTPAVMNAHMRAHTHMHIHL